LQPSLAGLPVVAGAGTEHAGTKDFDEENVMTATTTTVLVTGATGTVGSHLALRLGEHRHLSVRAAVRSPARSRATLPPGITAVEFDFGEPALMRAALEGVDRLFLLAPNLPDPVGASIQLIELARAAGVQQVVKLSAMGCDREAVAFGRAHRAVEEVLERSGMAWTFVRPNNFMENFLGERHGVFAPDAGGVIRLPWGNGACSFVAASDIAAVAAAALAAEDPRRHAERAYEVTGPEALRMDQVAAVLAEVRGTPVSYVDTSEDAARAALRAAHLPPPMVEAVLELHALGKQGRTAQVTSTVSEVTGSPATSFAEFARAHAKVTP
jgi:uncharacterized protein YbjT (DUF2867 family)